MEPRIHFQGMNSTSLCSLAGRYDKPIPTWFLAPTCCLNIPARGNKPFSEHLIHFPHFSDSLSRATGAPLSGLSYLRSALTRSVLVPVGLGTPEIFYFLPKYVSLSNFCLRKALLLSFSFFSRPPKNMYRNAAVSLPQPRNTECTFKKRSNL